MTSILVVEDHQEWCSILKEDLESAGYRVDTAHSLETALDNLKQNHYQVVVTDIGLSKEPEDTSGIEILKWIKANRSKSTKTLAISGRAALGLNKEDFKKTYGVLEYIDRINYDSDEFLELVMLASQEDEQEEKQSNLST